MAPTYVKGGIWSNVEDQVLKAAISKYGLNQWARVASLLPKKSAKQAKARWNEWLNPEINRTEWKRDEDERLLRLAKILPNQWRSIAPLLGRTATQCVDRYEKLLESASINAEADEIADLSAAGPGAEALPAAGSNAINELSIDAESRAARPDEDDMEDEEREMLSEARARLANTQGKKAKRKARERMLEETKRLAQLQKRRELKAAGILSSLESKNKKRKMQFDYSADIPFQHEPPQGQFDVTEEDQANEKERNEFRKMASRKGLHLDDERKKPKAKASSSKPENPAIVEGVSFLYDDDRKKRKLNLPPPSIHNEDSHLTLEKMASDSNGISYSTDGGSIDERIETLSRDLLRQREQKTPLDVDTVQIELRLNRNNQYLEEREKEDLISLYRKLLTTLPQPKSSKAIIVPLFEEVSNDLQMPKDRPSSAAESELPLSSRTTDGQTLVKVEKNNEKFKDFEKGSIILDPSKVKHIVRLRYDEVDLKIYDEFKSLISVSYNKYKDHSYPAPPLKSAPQKYLKEAQVLIDEELKKNPPQEFSFPDTIASKLVFDQMREIFNELSKSIYERKNDLARKRASDFELANQLEARISELFQNLYTKNIEIHLAKNLEVEEDIAISRSLDSSSLRTDRMIKIDNELREKARSMLMHSSKR